MADQMEKKSLPIVKSSTLMPLFTSAEIEKMMFGDLGKYSWFHFCTVWSAIKSGKYIVLLYLKKLKLSFKHNFTLYSSNFCLETF